MAKNSEKYAYLNRLSTEQLEELLRMDAEEARPGNEDVVFHILEVIEQRENEHPTGRVPDVDKAWAEFQEYYDIPEGTDASLYPYETESNGNADYTTELSSPHKPRLRRCLKQALIAVVAVAAVFGGMVVAQASGFDVFGTLGRWTDDVFHFVPVTDASGESAGIHAGEIVPEYDALQEALVSAGIDKNLAPTWCPDGFTALEPETVNSSVGNAVYFVLSGRDGEFISLDFVRYHSRENLEDTLFEKDVKGVEQYSNGEKTFYILSNIDTITATWSDGIIMTQFSGDTTEDVLKKLIDSVGGR